MGHEFILQLPTPLFK